MDHLSVDQRGAPGDGGQQPEEENDLYFIVEWKPETEEKVGYLLGDGDDGEDYPVGHPVDVVLGRGGGEISLVVMLNSP